MRISQKLLFCSLFVLITLVCSFSSRCFKHDKYTEFRYRIGKKKFFFLFVYSSIFVLLKYKGNWY